MSEADLRVALTFDDGPGPSTGPLLDVLARHRAHATFFLVGRNLRGGALDGDAARAHALAERAAREGHQLGNHSDSHTREPIAPEVYVGEIRAVELELRGIYERAGRPSAGRFAFRLPYGPLVREGGAQDARLEAVAAAGRTHQHWTGIFGDWEPETTAAALSDAVCAHVREMWSLGLAPVVVLHDAGTRLRSNGFDRSATVAAVDLACAALAASGARFVTLAELGD